MVRYADYIPIFIFVVGYIALFQVVDVKQLLDNIIFSKNTFNVTDCFDARCPLWAYRVNGGITDDLTWMLYPTRRYGLLSIMLFLGMNVNMLNF